MSSLSKLSRPTKKPTSQEIANSLINEVIYQLQNQICKSQLLVNQQHDQLKVKKAQKSQSDNTLQLKMLLQKKQLMQKELQLISNQQKQIKNNSQTNHHPIKIFKSQLTKEDLEKIKKLHTLQAEFQRSLQKKTKDYEIMLIKFEKEKKELQMERKKQQSVEKKKEIALRLNQISQRQKKRNLRMQEDNKSLAKIIKKKKLFQQLDEKWKITQLKEYQQKELLKKQIKKCKNVDFQNIKEHQQKYDQIMKKQREQRNKRSTQMYNEPIKTPPSHFLHTVFLEDERIKKQNQQRINRQRENVQKKQAFAQLVRIHYKPKVVKRQPLKELQNSSSELRSLSVAEKYKQGTQYMRLANQKIVKDKNKERKNLSKQQNTEKAQEYGYSRYQDYLTNARLKRDPNLQHNNEISQIKTILKNQNTSKEQKFMKANQIAHKIEEKNGNKYKNLVNSISAKLQILKQLTV